MKHKIIIGGGISGLVFQMYHPEYTIITPDIGGLYKSAYIATVHRTAETHKLLKDLGYENPSKLAEKSYLGYYNNGWIQETLSPELNLLVIQKKMSRWNEPINRDFKPQSFDMSTSRTVNYFNTFDIDSAEVVEKVKDRAGKIIQGSVISIDNTAIVYKDEAGIEQMMEYESLVSTIAAPIFWKLYGIPTEFPHTPITNIISPRKPPLFDDGFHIVYYDDSVPYSRITHLGNKYAIELTGLLPKEEVEKVLPGIEMEKYLVVQYGRISNVLSNDPPNPRITFLGRFAEWKYGIVLETVLKKTLEYVPVQ